MSRQVLITVLLSVFIALLGIGIIIPVMPVFATELGANGLALGMIIAVFSVSRGVLQPVIGNLSDRYGRKGFLVVGLFVYGLVGLLIVGWVSAGAATDPSVGAGFVLLPLLVFAFGVVAVIVLVLAGADESHAAE